MKKKLLPILFLNCLLSSQLFSQQSCNDEAIMNMQGKWVKHADANMKPDKNQAQLFKRLDLISSFFQTAYSDLKGIEPAWYRTMNSYPLINNGPTAYNFNSLYKSYYCNQNLHKMMLGDETGTWAYVFINSLNWFLTDQYDRLQTTVDGNSVYILPVKKGEWKGYPLYETSSHRAEDHHCIILTHGSLLPWKPITQEQYLKPLRAQWEESKKKSLDSYTLYEENLKKSIVETQNNKYLKTEDKEKVIAGLQKSITDRQKTKDADIAKTSKYWNDKISIIDNYIKTATSETLQQPALVDNKTIGDFKGAFSTEEKGGRSLVIVNQAYFNTQLPTYVPQLIILYWRWEKNAPSQYFKKQFEENFPVDKLEAMINE